MPINYAIHRLCFWYVKPLRQNHKLGEEIGGPKRYGVLLSECFVQHLRGLSPIHKPKCIHIFAGQQGLQDLMHRTIFRVLARAEKRLFPTVIGLIRYEWPHGLAQEMLLVKPLLFLAVFHLETMREAVHVFDEVVIQERWPAFNMMDPVDIVPDVTKDELLEHGFGPHILHGVQRVSFRCHCLPDPAVEAFCKCRELTNVSVQISPCREWNWISPGDVFGERGKVEHALSR